MNKTKIQEKNTKKSFVSFLKKYCPTSCSDIYGNDAQMKSITIWLKKYDENKNIFINDPKKKKKTKKQNSEIQQELETEQDDDYDINMLDNYVPSKNKDDPHSCMLVIGSHGVGKTCSVLAVLKELKYDAKLINLTKMIAGKSKTITDITHKILRGDNIYDHLNEKHSKMAIVVDEIESAGSPVEKNFIINLLKNNELKWVCPIIFISNGKHSRMITQLKKVCNIVQFNPPVYDNMMKLIIKIGENENMKFANVDIAKKVIDHSQHDYRRLILIMEDLYHEFGRRSITEDNIEEFEEYSKKKDTNVHIFDAVSEMVTNYSGIEECLRSYDGEKVIIPLVMHQNFINFVINGSSDRSFDIAEKMADSISMGDTIEQYIYNDQNWDMQDVHGFFSCANPASVISTKKLSRKQYLSFPLDLNRTSIKKINHKNVINATNCLKNLEIMDFIYLNKLIRQLLKDKKYNECIDLFRGYNIRTETIESILKIDKINDVKFALSNSVKKQLGSTNNQKKQNDNKQDLRDDSQDDRE